MRPRSSTQISKKWLPDPSVPNCLIALSSRSWPSSVAGRCAASHRSALRPWSLCPWPTPAGMARSMRPSSGSSVSGSWSSVRSSSAAIMPQPMSTPTAAGMIAPLVGMTDPTVAPMPTWASGMRATWSSTIGRRAAFSACRIVAGSTSLAQDSSRSLTVVGIGRTSYPFAREDAGDSVG
jgi:hypothetical protein